MVFIVFAAGYFLLQTSRVQTWIIRNIAEQVAENTGAEITIGKVNIGFFDKVVLRDVLVETQDQDTLFYTSKLLANLDTLKFSAKKISFSNIEFDQSRIDVTRDSSGEYSFNRIMGPSATKKDHRVKWSVRCSRFSFRNADISFQDERSEIRRQLFVSRMNMEITDIFNKNDSLR